jgi:ABC-2 type transport system permease protein
MERGGMTGSVRAELLVLRKRTSSWILLGIWSALALVFAYVVPYVTYLNDSGQEPLGDLLPHGLVGSLMGGFPFFGGVLALMLGVLTFGSEYGWGTLKTLFTQRPGRLRVFGAKLIALAIGLVPFVLVVFALGAVASYAIALREGAEVDWPSAWLVLRGLAAGWLILAVWAAFGVVLAVLSRGTALATGIGILYALVIEGLLSALAGQVSLLDRLVEFFLRANAYSLVTALGVPADDVANNGPGSFSGPFVDAAQALLVLGSYAAAFLLLAGWLLRRRDVT